MMLTLHKSFLKCIAPENKSGITFVEVVVVGLLTPLIIRNVKNYVFNNEKSNVE
jgi:hypothetical protein